MGSGVWDQSRFKFIRGPVSQAPPVFLPSRRERGFSAPRQSLGQGPDLRVHSPSNANVSAADPAPSPSLTPSAHQVPVRAMAALCERPEGVWTKLFWRFQVGPLNRLEEFLAGDKTGRKRRNLSTPGFSKPLPLTHRRPVIKQDSKTEACPLRLRRSSSGQI